MQYFRLLVVLILAGCVSGGLQTGEAIMLKSTPLSQPKIMDHHDGFDIPSSKYSFPKVIGKYSLRWVIALDQEETSFRILYAWDDTKCDSLAEIELALAPVFPDTTSKTVIKDYQNKWVRTLADSNKSYVFESMDQYEILKDIKDESYEMPMRQKTTTIGVADFVNKQLIADHRWIEKLMVTYPSGCRGEARHEVQPIINRAYVVNGSEEF